jgi:heterotetrameric sarcosine oxidase gamma subunit
MDELAPIAHRRSAAIDWSSLRGCAHGGIGRSTQANPRFTAHTALSATLLKASRHAALETLVARELQVPAPISLRVHRRDGITWLWQGPHEWLLLGDEPDGPSLAARFAAKLAGLTAAAIDVSDRTLVLEIEGSEAPDLIAKATSLDLSQLESRGCCRTRFAGLHASLFRLDASQSFGLVVDRALSIYLHSWLETVLTGS